MRKDLNEQEITKKSERIRNKKKPVFLQTVAAVVMKESKCTLKFAKEEVIDKLFHTFDNLHNIDGACAKSINKMIKEKYIHKETFDKNMQEVLGRNLSDCDGKKKKELLIHHEKIIKPAILQQEGESKITDLIMEFFHILSILSWISYQVDDVTNYIGIVVWLHWLCFRLGELCLKLPANLKIITLYLHIIVCHFPQFMRERAIGNYSCEKGEGLNAQIKKKYSKFY